MGASHAAMGVGAGGATAYLTTLLTGFHGLDADHAAAAAGLMTMVATFAFVILHNRWPNIFGGN